MRSLTKKTGFSLTELLVAMSIIGVLAGIGVPAVKQVVKSFESSSRVGDVVGAAMSNARAMALARGKYIGIRFQQTPQGDQYMVFIEHDFPGTGLANGFRPVTGRNPIRLPKRGLVMDMHLRTANSNNPVDAADPSYVVLNSDGQINSPQEVTDSATLCVIFSPAGKLVNHAVRIRNVSANDNVFNTQAEVDLGNAMFYIDSYPGIGLGEEISRNRFIIVDKNEFGAVPATERYSRYLQHKVLETVYINPYTGELISN
ncbi:MAG: prepilin-type N-terminal cleavage/methylation domain-containing protein [Planctomycetes bacterium]|nr:prepilin-type N-terminal cleavage/methylation domain-containing protein [Planctomycetota bacterium]